jgi:hypothetical protein
MIGPSGSGYNSSANMYNSMAQSPSGSGGGGGGAGSASDRAEAVAEATFQESLKAKMISGLYAAAKEIRS